MKLQTHTHILCIWYTIFLKKYSFKQINNKKRSDAPLSFVNGAARVAVCGAVKPFLYNDSITGNFQIFLMQASVVFKKRRAFPASCHVYFGEMKEKGTRNIHPRQSLSSLGKSGPTTCQKVSRFQTNGDHQTWHNKFPYIARARETVVHRCSEYLGRQQEQFCPSSRFCPLKCYQADHKNVFESLSFGIDHCSNHPTSC